MIEIILQLRPQIRRLQERVQRLEEELAKACKDTAKPAVPLFVLARRAIARKIENVLSFMSWAP